MLQNSFLSKRGFEASNQSSYFEERYKVPEKKEKPDWNTSFAALKFDVRETRPLLVLNREDREAKTLDRINKFRLLAAGKTNSKVTNPDRDSTLLSRSEWQEELDRKFHKLSKSRTRAKISPRTAIVNRDVKSILREEKMRKLRLEEKIRHWEMLEETERTERIIARKKGRGKLLQN